MAQYVTGTAGKVPYIADDTRAWVDAYRVNNKIKPALIFRAATDSNYIYSLYRNDLPAYGSKSVLTQAICNILAPGQRIPGCLQWSVTESSQDTVNQAQLTVLDALPVSTISTTISGFGLGTKGSNGFYADTNGNQTGITYSQAIGGNYMKAEWHSPIIRYQWVLSGDGVSVQLPSTARQPGLTYAYAKAPQGPSTGNFSISSWTDQSTGQAFREENLQYRLFEPEIIFVNDLSNFPDPAVPNEESEGNFNLEGALSEWWEIDTNYSKRGIGAYYVLVGQEVMRVTMIDRNTNALYVIPGGRGAAGYIQQHNIGDQITLLGQAPFTGEFAGFGYLMPADFAVEQSILRPGTCFVSYEGYGNPGDYLDQNGQPVPLKSASWSQAYDYRGGQSPELSPVFFDRNHNMPFTGYWFTTSPEITLDDTGVPKITATFNSAGYVLTQQQITQDSLIRMAGILNSWITTSFDAAGQNRGIPGTWLDFNNWDPTWPNSYPLKIEISFAQDQDFLNHMQSTNFGIQCPQCIQEFEDYVINNEGGVATGSIQETRSVGKHIYEESICVFNNGSVYDAGPLRTYGRLMHTLGIAAWENPVAANTLGSRWTKMPDVLFNNLQNFSNGRCWNGQLSYKWHTSDPNQNSQTYDYTNPTDTIEVVSDPNGQAGNRIPLTCPFTGSYDRQPWTAPMQDLCGVNRMTYYITREGYPVFVPIGRKLRGCPGSKVTSHKTPSTLFVDQTTGYETADQDQGRGEWHLAYGGSIDEYDHTIDPSGVVTVCYVTATTALAADSGGSAVQFTLAAGGTGMQIAQSATQQGSQKLVWYPGIVGNVDGLKLTGGVQVSDEVSLDQLQLGLNWNTKPKGYNLSLNPNNNQYSLVPALPKIPDPNNHNGATFGLGSDGSARYPAFVNKIKTFLNFMIQRRYIGGAFMNFVQGATGITATPLAVTLLTGQTWDLNTTQAVVELQSFLLNPTASGAPAGATYGWYSQQVTFVGKNGQKQTLYNNYGHVPSPGYWDQATYQAAYNWAQASAEYIETDIWWYAMAGMQWNDYVLAICGLPVQQYQTNDDGTYYVVNQTAMDNEINTWAKRFDADVVNYGNMIVDTSIQQASETVLSVNYADPRIQIGDVVWAQVPGYLSSQNIYGNSFPPYTNGVYLTSLTRTMDLQAGTYQGTYTGYAYRGFFDDNVMSNPINYVSSANQAA